MPLKGKLDIFGNRLTHFLTEFNEKIDTNPVEARRQLLSLA